MQIGLPHSYCAGTQGLDPESDAATELADHAQLSAQDLAGRGERLPNGAARLPDVHAPWVHMGRAGVSGAGETRRGLSDARDGVELVWGRPPMIVLSLPLLGEQHYEDLHEARVHPLTRNTYSAATDRFPNLKHLLGGYT
jgi:hypothetical protein